MSVKPRRITITQHEDGSWTAHDEPTGRTAAGQTPREALDSLTTADAASQSDRPTDVGTQSQRETAWDCYG